MVRLVDFKTGSVLTPRENSNFATFNFTSLNELREFVCSQTGITTNRQILMTKDGLQLKPNQLSSDITVFIFDREAFSTTNWEPINVEGKNEQEIYERMFNIAESSDAAMAHLSMHTSNLKKSFSMAEEKLNFFIANRNQISVWKQAISRLRTIWVPLRSFSQPSEPKFKNNIDVNVNSIDGNFSNEKINNNLKNVNINNVSAFDRYSLNLVDYLSTPFSLTSLQSFEREKVLSDFVDIQALEDALITVERSVENAYEVKLAVESIVNATKLACSNWNLAKQNYLNVGHNDNDNEKNNDNDSLNKKEIKRKTTMYDNITELRKASSSALKEISIIQSQTAPTRVAVAQLIDANNNGGSINNDDLGLSRIKKLIDILSAVRNLPFCVGSGILESVRRDKVSFKEERAKKLFKIQCQTELSLLVDSDVRQSLLSSGDKNNEELQNIDPKNKYTVEDATRYVLCLRRSEDEELKELGALLENALENILDNNKLISLPGCDNIVKSLNGEINKSLYISPQQVDMKSNTSVKDEYLERRIKELEEELLNKNKLIKEFSNHAAIVSNKLWNMGANNRNLLSTLGMKMNLNDDGSIKIERVRRHHQNMNMNVNTNMNININNKQLINVNDGNIGDTGSISTTPSTIGSVNVIPVSVADEGNKPEWIIKREENTKIFNEGDLMMIPQTGEDNNENIINKDLILSIDEEKFQEYLDGLKPEVEIFSKAVVRRVREAEHVARKWQREARSYRDKYHSLIGSKDVNDGYNNKFNGSNIIDGRDRLALKRFRIGDLALFLPTRQPGGNVDNSNINTTNSKDGKNKNGTIGPAPWAAFNIGAPHYFLREVPGHKLSSRDWLVARITNIEEHIVNLSNRENKNPFGLADGLRWYLLDAYEELPGNLR